LADPILVDVQDWYDETYASSGLVEAWVWETVKGRDYASRRPHFAAFVTVSERLDRRTAQIVSLALRENRTVLAFNPNMQLLSVNQLMQREDEAGGWAVSGALIGG
jgi:hypothetical protein